MLGAMPMRTNGRPELTRRQREVLRLIAQGKTNFEIAKALGISLDGAKWHIREIMAKLGCDSRDEAVAVWRSRQSVRQRVGRAIGAAWGFAGSPAWQIAASVGLAVALIAAFAVVISNRADEEDGAAPLAGETPTPSPLTSPVVAPTTVKFPDGPIAFRSCGTSSWTRPSLSEMADVFTNARFGLTRGTTTLRPAPVYFSYYLKQVYRIAPRAVSANIESVALSGSNKLRSGPTTPLIPATKPCDQTFRQDRAIEYHEFWFIDMVPVGVQLDAGVLTIEAERMPGSFTDFVFPDPPVTAPSVGTKDQNSLLPAFRELRVRDATGRLIYSHGLSGEVQYAEDGGLVSATAAFGNGEVEFEIRGQPQTVVVYATVASGLQMVDVRDASGVIWPSDATLAAPETWHEVFRGELPVGKYRVGGSGILVVPAGTPLP